MLQVSAIKSGMWNSIYDTVQVFNHSELTNSPTKSSEYETIDVGPSLENVALVTKDSAENTKCESICLWIKHWLTNVSTNFGHFFYSFPLKEFPLGKL
jgi:hypothetical protein